MLEILILNAIISMVWESGFASSAHRSGKVQDWNGLRALDNDFF
jgi:hypothetical protein